MDFDSLQADPAASNPTQHTTASPSFDEMQSDEDKYGTAGQQVKTALEGAAQGVLGPLAPMAEKALGVKSEDIRLRAENNPITHGVSEVAGFGAGMLTGTGEAAVLSKVGSLAGKGAEALGVTNKIATGAAKMAAEMATFQAADETTKYILDAPNSVGGALTNIGVSGLLGGLTGGAFSAVAPLVSKGIEKLGLKEFADRFKYNMSGSNPSENIHNEIDQALHGFGNMNDEVWGAQGLKAQAMKNVMPEMNEKILGQADQILSKSNDILEKMVKDKVPDRFVQKLTNDIAALKERIQVPTEEGVTQKLIPSDEMFDAMQDFKKTLQNYSKGKWGEEVLPAYHEAHDFVNFTKDLGRDVRLALEDSEVWGKSADIQKDLNKAFKEVMPAIKDMKGKFTSKVGGELTVDPAKIQTYLNQNGKATSQSIRQKMVGNFVDKFDNYQKEIGKIYEKAGIESPHEPIGLSALRESLDKPSAFAKAADYLYNKGLSQAGAGGLGAYAGHAAFPGLGFAGVLLGEKMGEHLLPGILQPLIEKAINSGAFKKGIEMTENALKGEKLLNNTVRGLFKTATITTPKHLYTDDKDVKKLDKQVSDLSTNPGKLMNSNSSLAHYMPNHAQEVANVAGKSVQYLNSIKPQPVQASPLDKKQEPSKQDLYKYHRQLGIANNPASVIEHIKTGTLHPQDVATIQAIAPALYSQMSKKIYDEMTTFINKGGLIPYKTRQSLSLFLGQPLDSTMSPMSIVAAQGVFQPIQQQNQAPAQTKKNTGKLGKTTNSYRTPTQTAAEDRANRD